MKAIYQSILCAGLVFTLSSCDPWDYEQFEAPALENGECEIISEDAYSSPEKAQSALVAIKNILADETKGGVLEVLDEEVYLSSQYKHKRKDKIKDLRWSYQVVFKCDNASLHFEKKRFSTSVTESQTKQKLSQRIADLKIAHPNKYKELSQKIEKYELSYCDTCCDQDGNNCGDCNCSYDYEYEYRLRYMILVVSASGGSTNGRVADWYDNAKTMSDKVGLRFNDVDSLRVAEQMFPKGSPLSQKIKKAIAILEHLDNEKPNCKK